MAGRPTKYTPEKSKEILGNLSIGCSRKASAEAAGIDEVTLIRWMQRYENFASAVLETEAKVERSAVTSVRQAWMDGDWRAAIEWLKRRRSKEWSETHRLEIIAGVRELARETGKDEEAAVAEAEALLKELRGARRG